MKLEDGALQAYRDKKVIKSYLGYLYQIDELPCMHYRVEVLFGEYTRYLRLDDASHSELLEEWEIIEDPKQKLKEMISHLHSKILSPNGFTFPDLMQPILDYIDTLQIEEMKE